MASATHCNPKKAKKDTDDSTTRKLQSISHTKPSKTSTYRKPSKVNTYGLYIRVFIRLSNFLLYCYIA